MGKQVNLESRSDLMIGKWTSAMKSEDAVRTEKDVGDRQAGRQAKAQITTSFWFGIRTSEPHQLGRLDRQRGLVRKGTCAHACWIPCLHGSKGPFALL